MYAGLERIEILTELQEKAYKTLSLARRQYKRDHDRQVPFASIFFVADYIFLDRAPLLYSAAERSTSEGYIKLLPRRQELYSVIRVDENN